MNLPFTVGQFLTVFEKYNQAVWPVQIVLNLLALVALSVSVANFSGSSKIVTGIIGLLWIWTGTAYHMIFFRVINPAAVFFGALDIVQGLIFIYFGILKSKLSFKYRNNVYGLLGGVVILYSLVIYPLAGSFLGHVYPKSPTFGLPCPTTIFTFGLLLWTVARVPKTVLLIPCLWSLIGFSAAIKLGMAEDTGLIVAAVVVTTLLILRDRRFAGAKAEAERVS